MSRLQIRNPKSEIRNPTGVTLIEVVVATAIMGLVVTVIYAVLQSGITGWRTSELRFDVQQNLRQALDRMSRELRETGQAGAVLIEPNTLTSSLANDVVLAFKTARKVGDEKRVVFRNDLDCAVQIPLDYRPCWQAYIVYYLTEETGNNGPYVLRRQVISLSSPDTTFSSVSTLLTPDTARPIARRIGNFVAVTSGSTIDVTLTAEAAVPNLPAQLLTQTLRTSPRN